MLENERIKLKDGRILTYGIYGSFLPRTTIFYMHGFPSSRYEGRLWQSACAKYDIRLIVPDRPGIGRSTFQERRRILDWPSDVLALVNHLEVEQFYIIGVSGGAPYALACLKEFEKERLLGTTIISGLYPVHFGTSGMITTTRFLLWFAPMMTTLTATLIDSTMGKVSRAEDPKVFEDMVSKGVDSGNPVDRATIKAPGSWPTYVAVARESFYQGGKGVSWEAKLSGSDWGFDLEKLNIGKRGISLNLWHGTEDANCPVFMARRAEEAMPGCKLHLKQGEGHVSFIYKNTDEILTTLLGIDVR